MNEPALTRAIEERMLNAWPAVETMVAGDWLLRFANGYSKRANSATSLIADADMDNAFIAHLIARFARWGVPAVVRLTPLCAPRLEGRLAAHGFLEVEPTFAMLADLGNDIAVDARVSFASQAQGAWIAANAASYGGVKADSTKLSAILDRIRLPSAFATLSEDGADIAWGVAVAERGMVGLQDIVTAPEARGRGAARALVASLMAWGRGQGATQAYLHVTRQNEAARRLYRSLGFSDAYALTQRVLAMG